MEVEWTLGYALAEIQPALVQKALQEQQLGRSQNSPWTTQRVNIVAAWVSRVRSLLKHVIRFLRLLPGRLLSRGK